MKHTKYIVSSLRFFLLLAVLSFFSVASVWAADVTSETNLPDWYSVADGKSGSTLVTALNTICNKNYVGIKYGSGKTDDNSVWSSFLTTDVYPSDSTAKKGKLWDMYSNVLWTGRNQQCGNYSNVGDCYNREHSMPKSWFGVGSDPPIGPGTDMHHMYPTDGEVNNQRSNYPFGECSGGEYKSYGSYKGAGKLGTSTLTDFTTIGTVWEPDDQYKGDFARTYMYMLMKWCAQGTSFTQDSQKYGKVTFNDTFTSAGNYGLTDYGVALLMKWHRQDPVSRKERDRNNAVQSIQGNRNPFIDYPCLAEYLWGTHKDETVTISQLTLSYSASFVDQGCPCAGPTITSPTGTVNVGTTNTSTSIYKDITIQGVNLESGNLTLSITGTNSSYFKFPGNTSTLTITKAQAEAGYNVTITYTPTANGSHTATLNISGCGLTSPHTVTLTGTCTTVYTATWMANGLSIGTSTAASGASPDVPATNPSNCTSSRVFVGWTETSGYTGSSAPDNMFTTTAPTITTNKAFYAVYADATTSGSGSTGSVTITTSTTNIPTSYGTANTFTEYTLEGYKFKVQQMYLNDKKLQWRAGGHTDGTGTMYNTGVFPGKISSVVLTYNSSDANKNFTLKVGSSENPTSGTSITPSSSELVYTYDCSSENADYFVLTNGSYAGYLDKLVINYSGSTTTYRNYSTTCTAGATVTVTFHANGGSGTMSAQTIPQSTNTTLSTNTFTREGYSFAGWATTSGGSVVYTDGATINTSSNIDLYAKWTALPTYTVTFNNNGATYATRSGYTGQTMSAVSDPEPCDGYTFEGWSINQYTADNTATPALITPTSIPASNTTYYAVFSKTEGTGSPVLTNNYKKITTTAELTDGNYIIASSTHALKNAVTSNGYYLQEGTVTISSDVITSTDASIIWQIQKSGTSNYTIYNSNVKKYVYVWTNVSGSRTYYELGLSTEAKTFTAAYTSSKWQFKSTDYTSYMICYRGASYAYFNPYTSQTEALDLYKQQTEISSTTYHTTSPACSCTYTITATTDDSSQGTVSVTTP